MDVRRCAGIHSPSLTATGGSAVYSITCLFDDDARILLDVCSADAAGAVNTESMDASSITIRRREILVFRVDQENCLIRQENEAYFSMNTRILTAMYASG